MSNEVELRFRIFDEASLLDNLAKLEVNVGQPKRVVDYWFIPPEITDQKTQDAWFDSGAGAGVRLRVDYSDNDKPKITLGTKKVDTAHGHKALAEAEVEVSDLDRARAVLEMLDRRLFLTIDKTRQVFALPDFEICIDKIKDFGVGVEIEYKGELATTEALEKTLKFAQSLGLDAKDQFGKSLTVDAMQKLANYHQTENIYD